MKKFFALINSFFLPSPVPGVSWLRWYLLKFLGGVPKEMYRRETARLSTIIDDHSDDSKWLLEKLAIPEYRGAGYLLDRGKLNAYLEGTELLKWLRKAVISF